jgi:DoxX-like family
MQPKTTNIVYWVTTILFALFMMWTAVPSLMNEPQSKQFMNEILGYPDYFVKFISIAKLLGGAAVLIPGIPKTVKEWAYAGLFFDLAGAIVSVIAATGKADAGILFIVLPLIIGAVSYYFWKKRAA